MGGGDVYLGHKSLSNLLLLIKCILYLPTGAALSSNGSAGAAEQIILLLLLSASEGLCCRGVGFPSANRGGGDPTGDALKASKIILQIHSIWQPLGENEILTDNFMAACSDSCPRDWDADWVLESKQLVCSSTESCLFSVLLLNYRFVFRSYTISPKKKQVFRRTHGS